MAATQKAIVTIRLGLDSDRRLGAIPVGWTPSIAILQRQWDEMRASVGDDDPEHENLILDSDTGVVWDYAETFASLAVYHAAVKDQEGYEPADDYTNSEGSTHEVSISDLYWADSSASENLGRVEIAEGV